MNRNKFISIIIVAGVTGTFLIGISAMSQTRPEAGTSLLRKEMIALEEAFKAIIDAIIFDNMGLIKPTLPALHKAREKVAKAINSGEKIILPKNQDKFKEFVKLDDEFHEDFDTLEKAAEKGQKKVTKDQTHKVLDGCVVCHERFRK